MCTRRAYSGKSDLARVTVFSRKRHLWQGLKEELTRLGRGAFQTQGIAQAKTLWRGAKQPPEALKGDPK